MSFSASCEVVPLFKTDPGVKAAVHLRYFSGLKSTAPSVGPIEVRAIPPMRQKQVRRMDGAPGRNAFALFQWVEAHCSLRWAD